MVSSLKIKPVYLEDVVYIGRKTLDILDLSGDYAHCSQSLLHDQEGKRYFIDPTLWKYLVNERSRTLHITFREGDGLFIDKRGYYGVELFKHADPPRSSVSLLFLTFSYTSYTQDEPMLNPIALSQAIKDTFADYVSTTLSIADERFA